MQAEIEKLCESEKRISVIGEKERERLRKTERTRLRDESRKQKG